jgi:hypothetical protein
MNNKYLFVFCIVIFTLLSIIGPGLFLNDEWTTAQELTQVSQLHQITFNEGKYGYFANGTISNYVSVRHNILFYSLALPIVALPAHILFTSIIPEEFVRLSIIIFWFMAGLYAWRFLSSKLNKNTKLSASILAILITLFIINLILYTPYPMQGKFVPSEVVSIVFTNVILYGIFAVITLKITEILFQSDKYRQTFAWISVIACSSLIFWVGNLKDHILASLIVLAICYLQLSYITHNREVFAKLSFILCGLLIWIRPEIGIFVSLCVIAYNIIFIRRDIPHVISMLFWIAMGGIPFFINNYVATGSLITHPFQVADTRSINDPLRAEYMQQLYIQWNATDTFEYTNNFDIASIIKLLVAPISGAVSVITICSLFIISSLLTARKKLNKYTIFLTTIALASFIYYIYSTGVVLGKDQGILPDIRYMSAAYAPLALAAAYFIPDNLNYKLMIKRFLFISLGLLILFIALLASAMFPTYQRFSMVPNLLSAGAMFLTIILIINDKTRKSLLWMIPLLISIPFAWQISISFIDYGTKSCLYPMFLPITEKIYNMIFVGGYI